MAYKYMRYLLVLLLLPALPCLAEATGGQANTRLPDTQTSELKQEKQRQPLKYRNGPVCMCNDGMSEADIQAAKKKRAAK